LPWLREALGNVGQAMGDAYVSAASLWQERFATYKKFKRWLDKTDEASLRRRHPNPQRFELHAGDWHRLWAKQDADRFERLDDLKP